MTALAISMLFAWIPITVMIFSRLAPAKAVVISLLWAYLILPEKVGINLPVLPTLNKVSVPAITALVCYIVALKREEMGKRLARRRGRSSTPETKDRNANTIDPCPQRSMKIAAVALIFSCFLNYIGNRNPDISGVVYLRGMSFYDCLSYVQTSILTILPLFIARHALTRKGMGLFLLQSLAIAGLWYSLLVLFEVRMSPQINRWMYGFFAHDWMQHVRNGQYRPIVFLSHGLSVGIFIALATSAIAVLCKCDPSPRRRIIWWITLPYMLGVLYLSRNTGAFTLTLLAVPAIILLPTRLQIWAAAGIATIVLIYPVARGTGLIPTTAIVTQFEKVSEDRARSLAFRLKNEDILLERASIKPITGWGMFGRNRVYDPETGRDLSITDGIWIIVIGMRGWVGYISLFSLVCLPPIFLALRRGSNTRVQAGLCVILAVNLVDLIPNASMVAHIWLIAAALWAQLSYTQNITSTPNSADALKLKRANRTNHNRLTT